MKRYKVLIWVLFIVVVLALIKVFYLTPKKEIKSNPSNKNDKSAPSMVTVYTAVPKDLKNNVYATGSIIAGEEVMLVPEIAGKIISLNINEGSNADKGALLVKLNDADFLASLKKLELQKKVAQDKVSREKQLLNINGVSQEEYDLAVNALSSLEADVEFTKAQIAKTEIRAPFSGVIGLRYVSEGSYVNTNTRIASMQQVNPVKIDFSVPEKYAGILRKNDILDFTIPGNNTIFKAKVYAIEPKIDPSTRTIQLRAIANNDKGELFPGAFTKIKLPLQTIENAIMIPTEAIVPVLKGKKVFVCKNAKAVPVNVETGIRTDSLIQVISGLNAGDSVITTGIMQLKPGNPVKVVKAKK